MLGGVDDPELAQRRRTGRWILGLGVGLGCFGVIAVLLSFLALWQFLAPVERTVPPRRVAPPPSSAE